MASPAPGRRVAVSRATSTSRGVWKATRGVQGYLDLTRSLEGDPRIGRAEPYTKRLFVNFYLVTSESDLDDTFRSWIQEAWHVGEGDHLTS